MSEWRETPFKNYFAIGLRNGLTKPSKIRGTGIPMVNMKEIFAYDIITDNTPMELVPVTEKETETSLLNFNDLIFARQSLVESGAGKICIYKGNSPTVFESHLIRCRIDNTKANPDFIYYLFKSSVGKGAVSTIVQQVAAAGIRGSDLENLVFKFPPLPEQKAIASVLSSLDDKIDLLHRQNKTLEAMAETLFRQWFVEEQKEIWKIGKIKELVNILSGFPFKSSSFIELGKYQLITIKAVQDGQLNLVNADMINDIPSNMPDYCFLEIGDILLSLTGNVGRCCLVDAENLLLNQRVAKLHPKNVRDWALAYFLFRQPHIKSSLEEMAKGTAQANLSPVETSNMEFIIPDENTLQEFSFIATPWLQKIIFNKKSIRTIISVRNTLLPKLMSGEVRVAV